MTKYRVPLKIEFDGYAIVEARDECEAEITSVFNIKGTIGLVSDGGSDKISEFEFDHHGYAELRDNESIEEVEEEDDESLL